MLVHITIKFWYYTLYTTSDQNMLVHLWVTIYSQGVLYYYFSGVQPEGFVFDSTWCLLLFRRCYAYFLTIICHLQPILEECCLSISINCHAQQWRFQGWRVGACVLRIYFCITRITKQGLTSVSPDQSDIRTNGPCCLIFRPLHLLPTTLELITVNT